MGFNERIGGGLFGPDLGMNGGLSNGGHRQTSAQVHISAAHALSAQQRARLQAAALQNRALQQAVVTGTGVYEERPAEPEDTGITVGEVIGWRVWRACLGRLYSYRREDVEWPADEPLEAHKVGVVVGDGIHAFKTRKRAFTYCLYAPPLPNEIFVIGEVAMWGRMYEFEEGWHAEFAKPHSLLCWVPENPDKEEDLNNLRAEYGMDAG